MQTEFYRIIAIDGPAASGKSSVARELARQLDFVYVNSGAMYRAFTWHILQHGIAPDDGRRIAAAAGAAPIICDLVNNQARILIGNVDPTPHLRDDPVNYAVSQVSTVPEVRKVLTEKMRTYAETHDLVVEGRDIGSVVFPETPYKFYIDASPEVRSRRRAAQGHRDAIALRDQADSSRTDSPLIIAKDAEVIDSSNLSISAVVDEIVKRLRAKNLTI